MKVQLRNAKRKADSLDKEIQTEDVQFFGSGSEHPSNAASQKAGLASKNSLLSEQNRDGSPRSGRNHDGLLNDSSTAMNTLAPNNQSLLVDTSGMVHNESLDVHPDSPGMRSQRLRGVKDPI